MLPQVMFYLGLAYSANIGGTGTLTASEPNVIMKVASWWPSYLALAAGNWPSPETVLLNC